MVFSTCKPSHNHRRGTESSPFLPSMKKLCPNLDREDGLDTVLEVPIPEDMISSSTSRNSKSPGCTNMKSWIRPHTDRTSPIGRNAELQLMLGVVGAPLVPLPVHHTEHTVFGQIKTDPIEVSMAKYIVQQYIAAAGGEKAMEAITSMCVTGKVRMAASEFRTGATKKATKKIYGDGEVGGFVLWQKMPELWCLELVVSGCKLSAGSDGTVAWRQTPWHQAHASRGPPRPLRRSLQGLDPLSTANLFSSSVCVGEKTINGEDCFVLRLDAEAPALRSRSSTTVDIIRHTVWGYFSTRTGLLSQLDDSHLLRINSDGDECVYWETIMESSIEDYRTIDGVNIAHAGRTSVSLFRFGDTSDGHTRTRLEELWTVEEVDFNIVGLSMDCFLPPGDLREEKDGGSVMGLKGRRSCVRGMTNTHCKMGSSKVAAVEDMGFEEGC